MKPLDDSGPAQESLIESLPVKRAPGKPPPGFDAWSGF